MCVEMITAPKLKRVEESKILTSKKLFEFEKCFESGMFLKLERLDEEGKMV